MAPKTAVPRDELVERLIKARDECNRLVRLPLSDEVVEQVLAWRTEVDGLRAYKTADKQISDLQIRALDVLESRLDAAFLGRKPRGG